MWRSVKHEHVYLHGHGTVGELLAGLTEYFVLYNAERPHQALGIRLSIQIQSSYQVSSE